MSKLSVTVNFSQVKVMDSVGGRDKELDSTVRDDLLTVQVLITTVQVSNTDQGRLEVVTDRYTGNSRGKS